MLLRRLSDKITKLISCTIFFLHVHTGVQTSTSTSSEGHHCVDSRCRFLSDLSHFLFPTSDGHVLTFEACTIFDQYTQALSNWEMVRAVGPLNGNWHNAAHLLGSLLVDRDKAGGLNFLWYVQDEHQRYGTDANWGLCWPSLGHGIIWRSLHQNLSNWKMLAEKWCDFFRMRSKNYSIVILGQCWHGVGHGLFHATVMHDLSDIQFPCETPELHSLNESHFSPLLLLAYGECARHRPTLFAELWCANGIGHDTSQYIHSGNYGYCIHVTSFAAATSCFRYKFFSESRKCMLLLRCHDLLLIGAMQARSCIFAAASVSREMSSIRLSDCFAVSKTPLADVPNALVACAAGLQMDCSRLSDGASCRPMTWDILATSHSVQISALAEREEALDPRPWPMLAGRQRFNQSR